MADIKDMSREEIEQYLANMPKDTAEPSAKQKTAASEIMRGADGNYDVSKVSFSKMFADKANERSTGNLLGKKLQSKRGSKWQAYIDENITDPAAKADMEKQIRAIISANPNMSSKELKYRLRAIEANLKHKYPNGVSKNFDISGKMLDRTMAKNLLSLGIKGEEPITKPVTKPVTQQVAEKPAEQAPVTPKPTAQPAAQKGPATNDELSAAFKRIKNKQASDADLALFNKYSEEQLKKMGFGPISIAAIKGKKEATETTQPVKPTAATQPKTTGESAESIAARNRQDISGISDEDLRRIEAEADKKYPDSPELRQNYIENKLAQLATLKKKNSAKKTTEKTSDKPAKITTRKGVKGNMI